MFFLFSLLEMALTAFSTLGKCSILSRDIHVKFSVKSTLVLHDSYGKSGQWKILVYADD